MPVVTAEVQTKPQEVAVAIPTPPTNLSQRQQWMKAAGIPEPDWPTVEILVHKESSWNPKAINPSSGACGLAQALPCSKIPGDWSDPVNALKWQLKYVTERYGSYAGAWAFWQINQWY